MQSSVAEIETNQATQVTTSCCTIGGEGSNILLKRITKSTTNTGSTKSSISNSTCCDEGGNEIIYNIFDNDIIGGRGIVINKHVGNRRFRRIITANKETYAKCQRNSHKYFLALSIILSVERQGGRFLKRDEKLEQYVKISRKESVAKAAQALRDQLQSARSRKSGSTSSVERLIKTKQHMKLEKVQQGMDEHYLGGADDELSCGDDTTSHSSVDSAPMSPRAQTVASAIGTKPKVHFSDFADIMLTVSTTTTRNRSTAYFSNRHSVPRSLPSSTHAQLLSSTEQIFIPTTARRHSYDTSFLYSSTPPSSPSSSLPSSSRRCTRPASFTSGSGSSNSMSSNQNHHIWVPQELEQLMLADPDAVQAIAAL